MPYEVIARKYRPQRFADVVGQDHVTQTLGNAIRQNRIAHAYLFVGPRGTGKTTIARIFAKCLNCTGGPQVDFAADDPRCQEISEGRSLDVLEIDGASNRGIEEIRSLRETVKFAPSSSPFRIYIIDEVHMLTKEAFNALLKTLEEPPAHVKFMFATTEPEKVLATILSRCQRFDLRRIPVPLIVKHLAYIAGLEKVQIDDAALHAIARGADGCMRDAESAMDQLISFCGTNIVEADVLSMFGLAARAQIHALAQAVLQGEIRQALRLLNDLAQNGKDLGRLLSDLLSHFRNLLVFHVSNNDPGLLEVSENDRAALTSQANGLTVDALTRILDVLAETEERLSRAASKRILVEVALLKAIQARGATNLDAVLQQLHAWRSEAGAAPAAASPRTEAPQPALASAGNVAATPSAETPVLPQQPNAASERETAPAPAPPIPASSTTDNLPEIWDKVLEAVGRVSPFVRSYLLQARPLAMNQTLFTIGYDTEFADQLGLVDNPKNRTLIQTKLHELGLGTLQVKFTTFESAAMAPAAPRPAAADAPATPPKPAKSKPAKDPAESKPEKPAPTGVSRDDFKNDPLIKQALEIFKGQLLEPRP
jgi:DNA polymerase III subunit gamma/tau